MTTTPHLSPRATFLGWLFLLGLTLAVAVLGSGCGSATEPTAAKPEPKQTEDMSLVCLSIYRMDAMPVIVCGSARVCAAIHSKVTAVWGDLEDRYAATALSDCTTVAARFTEK